MTAEAIVAEAPRLPIAAQLEAMLTAALDTLAGNLTATLGGPVGRLVIAPGSVTPADGCCGDGCGSVDGPPCGQAHVRLAGIWPSTTFPQPDGAYRRCVGDLAVQIELGVYRCAAGLDASGNPPSPQEMTADAAVALDDYAAMRATALGVYGRNAVVLGAWTPLGPSGYCHGGSVLFTAAYNLGRPPAV